MDFFNDLGRRFSGVARSVSEKTRDGVESTRVAGDLRAQRNALDRLFLELGKECFEMRLGRGDEERAERVFQDICRVQERIEELNAQRDALRDVRRCPSCGGVMPREARFCSACGKRMPEDAPDPDPKGPGDVEYCPECGAQRDGGESYCAVCGRCFEARTPSDEDETETLEAVWLNIEEPEACDEE